MDGVSSTAACLQIIGQAISLVQQLYSAHEAVRAAPKQLSDTQALLENLRQTIYEIEHEPELQTPAIHAQLKVINGISEELRRVLIVMKGLQERSKMYQGLYMLMKKTRDEGRLTDVLERLGRAKAGLAIRINVAHVGLTGGIKMGVERIEKDILTSTIDEGGKKVRKKGEEEEKKKRRRRKRIGDSGHFHDLRVDENVVEEDGTQMNGIVGFGEGKVMASTRASVVGNRASGRGQQKNFILGSGGIAELRGLGL